MEQPPSYLKQRKTMTSNGRIISLDKPLVMGIINVTDDSFYNGSRYKLGFRIAARAEQIIREGGSIIDVGACSTRPGAKPVSEQQELKRLAKALHAIRKKYPEAIISVDTYRSRVARMAVGDYRANIINDISAGELDPEMFSTIAELKIPYVLMHMRGTPETMQQNPTYDNVIREIITYLNGKIEQLKQLGVSDIIVDPGFGFGKTVDHNFSILKNLQVFRLFERPILVGLSRKSMISKTLGIPAAKCLNGTTVLNTMALLNGATILRVHDVREATEAIKLVESTTRQPDYQYI
ncbi:MAG TPA: dihydropteroate synthase [Tenuifilaceae bacterium]|nr:dihydropteroate synthase [Tenuifilaceae bacterium]HOA09237.1 dihydropteroate synthase [Tenuifilaceae bacterium]HOC36974.1 dihydropteroate synthase [Tenuifilaceae bacterium]HOG72126.1 dihydropteroate synthase [Tenuifilaceae bacterium]HPA67545.1 dihydropteroate synthase [Tenuifilaceae bacterium]